MKIIIYSILKEVWYYIERLLPPVVKPLFKHPIAVTGARDETVKSKIKAYYAQRGFLFDDKWTFGAFRNVEHPKGRQVFNDIGFICKDGVVKLFWLTTEPGKTWKKDKNGKYPYGVTWPGLIPLGYYHDLYKAGSFKGPALRMVGRINMIDVATGKMRKGGGCHVHRRSSKGEFVGFASAGCQVPRNEGVMDSLYEEFKSTGRNLTAYMIGDLRECDLRGEVIS
jgi:hypothetical protein